MDFEALDDLWATPPAEQAAAYSQEAESVTLPSAAARREHYRAMLRSRVVEEGLRSLYRQGRIVGGVYLGLGQEALSAACGLNLRAGTDIFAPLIRDCAGRLAFGESLVEALRACEPELRPARAASCPAGQPASRRP